MAVALDATSSAQDNGEPAADATLSWSHTVGTGDDRLLVVAVSTLGGQTTVGVTYNGVPLTEVISKIQGSYVDVALFYLRAPASGANTIKVTSSATPSMIKAGGISFTGAVGVTGAQSTSGSNSASDSISLSITSRTGDMVVDCLASQFKAGVPSEGASQTTFYNDNGAGIRPGAGSYEAGAASVTMSWTVSDTGDNWSLAAMNILAGTQENDIVNATSLGADLVSCWLADDSGLTADLVTGTGNDLTNSNVSAANGVTGNAGDFELASNSNLSIADASQTGLDPSGDYSLAAWVKFESVSSLQTIFGKWDSGQEQYLLRYDGSNGDMDFFQEATAGSHSFSYDSAAFGTEVWHHVVVAIDAGNEAKMYIDGEDVATGSSWGTDIEAETGAFYLGITDGVNWEFDGEIHQAAFWGKTLTHADVSNLYNGGKGIPFLQPDDVSTADTLPTSLVSYWEMEEATDATRVDSHGSNDLDVANSVAQGTGKIDFGADFEAGDSDVLSILDADQTGLDFSDDMSWSGWVNLETATNNPTLFNKRVGTGNQRAYTLQIVATGGAITSLNFVSYTDGSSAGCNETFNWTPNPDLAQWYHIVFTKNGTSTKVYIDGVQTGGTQTCSNATIYNASSPFELGSLASDNYLDGVLDEVGIWSKELTFYEANILYNKGFAIPYVAGGAANTSNFFQLF